MSAASPKVEILDIWPEPQPLPNGIPPVAAFDVELLPESVRPWVSDIADRIQCPPDFVAVSVMAALGSLIGRKVGIRPQRETDWTVTANQWALVVGRPGVLKSPAIEAALAPMKRLAGKATDTFAMEQQAFRVAQKVAELKASEGEKSARKLLSKDANADVGYLLELDEAAPPTLKRYTTNDSSAAALGELHIQNPNGVLVHRDEIVSLLRSLDREDNCEARGFYLTGWNGDSAYTFDRIGRGMNLHIPAVCLSLLGSTQPGRISEYIRHAVRGGAADDGLIQRFGLLVWPDVSGEWRNVDRWPDSEARRTAYQAFERLDTPSAGAVGTEQDTGFDGEPDGLPYLRFSGAAHEVFLEWRTVLENKLRSGDLHPALESHFAKYRKLVPGLALIGHLADGGIGPVSIRSTLRALAWAEYLETHAVRAYGSVTMPEAAAAKAIIHRLRRGDLNTEFAGWNVWRPGWAGLSDRQLVNDALQLLADLDWLFCSKQETGGRVATIYTVNPKGLEQ